MKKLIIIILLVAVAASVAFATAQTGDKRTYPVMCYGKTDSGLLVALQVDSNGVVQLS